MKVIQRFILILNFLFFNSFLFAKEVQWDVDLKPGDEVCLFSVLYKSDKDDEEQNRTYSEMMQTYRGYDQKYHTELKPDYVKMKFIIRNISLQPGSQNVKNGWFKAETILAEGGTDFLPYMGLYTFKYARFKKKKLFRSCSRKY